MGFNRHGHSLRGPRSATYRTWRAMKNRCLNPNRPDYSRYGGAGVTVCERWLDFREFLKDMGERPEGKTLDRIDNSKGYSKANCRWSTPLEQIRNSSAIRLSDAEVQAIRDNCARGLPQRAVANMYGVSQQYISKVVRGERRAHSNINSEDKVNGT